MGSPASLRAPETCTMPKSTHAGARPKYARPQPRRPGLNASSHTRTAAVDRIEEKGSRMRRPNERVSIVRFPLPHAAIWLHGVEIPVTPTVFPNHLRKYAYPP